MSYKLFSLKQDDKWYQRPGKKLHPPPSTHTHTLSAFNSSMQILADHKKEKKKYQLSQWELKFCLHLLFPPPNPVSISPCIQQQLPEITQQKEGGAWNQLHIKKLTLSWS